MLLKLTLACGIQCLTADSWGAPWTCLFLSSVSKTSWTGAVGLLYHWAHLSSAAKLLLGLSLSRVVLERRSCLEDDSCPEKNPHSISHHDASPMSGKLFARKPKMLSLQATHFTVLCATACGDPLRAVYRQTEGCRRGEAKDHAFTSKALPPAQKPPHKGVFLTQNECQQ